MARIPSDLYRPILEHLYSTNSDGSSNGDLLALLTVSKGVAREVQRILYHTLVLSADRRFPTLNDSTRPLVRRLKIVVGNRTRDAEHIRRCEDALPTLEQLLDLEIRGRGWNMDVFTHCVPACRSLRRLALDCPLSLPVAHLIAAQPDLRDLDLLSGMANQHPNSDAALEALPSSLPSLVKLSTSNSVAALLLPRVPNLQHIRLAFDLPDSLEDVITTLQSLPAATQTVFLNTTRKDLTQALGHVPKTIKNLAVPLIVSEQPTLIQHVSAFSTLETIVLNVCQPPIPILNMNVNPFQQSSPSTPLSSSPSSSLSPFSLPPSPKPSPRTRVVSLSPSRSASPIDATPPQLQPQTSSDGHDEVVVDEEEPIFTALRTARPSLAAVHLDEHVYQRRRRSWTEGERKGEWNRTEMDVSRVTPRSSEEIWESL